MTTTISKVKLLIFILLFVGFLSSCTSVQQTLLQSAPSHNQHEAGYITVVNEIQTEPVVRRITKLREFVILTGRNKSHAVAEEKLNQRAFEAIEALDWLTCLDITDDVLALNYASLNSHYAAMVCQLESGDTIQSQYHESVMNQLLEAVWLSGDGESLKTAFQVINRAERDAFIEFHGLEFIKHNFTRLDGQDYDVVTLYDAQKDDSFEWYFTSN